MTTRYVSLIADEDDHETIVLHFTGGIKAWKVDDDKWAFGPVLNNKQPVVCGSFSKDVLQSVISRMELNPIIVERSMSISGIKSVTWREVKFGKKAGSLSAAESWQAMSGNIANARVAEFKKKFPNADIKEILFQRDASTPEERFARYISDSLQSMDICAGAICNYYHEQLVAFMHQGRGIGEKNSTVSDIPSLQMYTLFSFILGRLGIIWRR